MWGWRACGEQVGGLSCRACDLAGVGGEMGWDSCFQRGALWLQRLEGTRAKMLVPWARPGWGWVAQPGRSREAFTSSPREAGHEGDVTVGESAVSGMRKQPMDFATGATHARTVEVWGKRSLR